MLGNSRKSAVADSKEEETSDSVPKALGWQATKPNVNGRISHMFCNEMLADVHFIIESDESRERIPAHKFMLSVSSAVFDAMFNGGLAQNANEIEVPDVEKPAFLNLLRFIYCDDDNMDSEDVIPTLYAAKKYGVYALERICVDLLESTLCADNALEYYAQSRLFDEENLARKCQIIIDTQAKDVFASESFTSADHSTIKAILGRDTLGMREMDIFQALCRWAEAECIRNGLSFPSTEQKRAAIGDLIYLIRFPLMSPKEFASGPAQSGMLFKDDYIRLTVYFNSFLSPSTPHPFSNRKRSCELSVARFAETGANVGLKLQDSFVFSTNRPISVTGFGLYGCGISRITYYVTIKISTSSDVLVSHNISFICDGSRETYKVSFPGPVRITAGTEYTASVQYRNVQVTGLPTLRGINGKAVVTSGGVTFRFSGERFKGNWTSQYYYGQIPIVYFQLSI